MKLIKGFVVESISSYVREKHQDLYDLWLDSLPRESKKIFTKIVLPTEWYSTEYGCDYPTRTLANLTQKDVQKLAWDIGRTASEKALNGIYKVFLSICSPQFLIKRSSNIYKSFYKPIEVNILSSSSKSVELTISDILLTDAIIYRIGGWMQYSLEKTNCRNVVLKLNYIREDNTDKIKYSITWE